MSHHQHGSTRRAEAALLRHVTDASTSLQRTTRGSARPVHDARKALKRARATLRLLRQALGQAEFRTLNGYLQAVGREVGGTRDAIALDEAFSKFIEAHGKRLPANATDVVQVALSERRFTSMSRLQCDAPLRLRNNQRLQNVLALSHAQLQRAGSTDIERGLRHQFSKMQRAYRLAKKTRDTLALHEWRKQLKYLYEALDSLSPTERGAQFVAYAKKLAERLGDDHDLAEIERWIGQFSHPDLNDAGRAAVIAALARRRAKLQQRLWHDSERLCAGSARRFVQRAA